MMLQLRNGALASLFLSASLASPLGRRDIIQPSTHSGSIINLGSASNFAIFAESGISLIPGDSSQFVTGSIGIAPADLSSITGFALADAGGYSTSSYVTSEVTGPGSAISTTPVPTDIINAYTVGMNFQADESEVGGGSLDGLTLYPGVYKWTTAVVLGAGQTLTLNGVCGDVFVFTSTGAFSTGADSQISLVGGVTASTIYWISATSLTTGVSSAFSGIIMTYNNVVIAGSLTGQAFVQTEIALHAAAITPPSLGISYVRAVAGICSISCSAGQDSSSGSCVAIKDGVHFSTDGTTVQACVLGTYGLTCNPSTGALASCKAAMTLKNNVCIPNAPYARFNVDVRGSDYPSYFTVDSESACIDTCVANALNYPSIGFVGGTYYALKRSGDNKNCFCKTSGTYPNGLINYNNGVNHADLKGHCTDYQNIPNYYISTCTNVFFSNGQCIVIATGANCSA